MVKNILLVDDEKGLTRLMVKFLKELELNCFVATNVTDAVNILEEKEIHICVTDYKMEDINGRNGVDLLKHIIEKFPHIKNVLISGSVSSKTVTSELGIDLHAFLAKPFKLQQLVEVVQLLL